MRLDINAGGLSRFMSGVSLFVNTSSSSSASKRLIDGLENIVSKTNSLTGGAGNLGTAASLINARRLKEEQRRNIINTVRTRTNNFISTAVAVDNQVAAMVEKSTEQFYQTHPWLRPPVPPSLRERVRNGLNRFWDGVKETAANVWNSVVDFVKENWKEIAIAIGVVLLVALTIVTLGKAAPLLIIAAKKIGLAAKGVALAAKAKGAVLVAKAKVTAAAKLSKGAALKLKAKTMTVAKAKLVATCSAIGAVAGAGNQLVSDLVTSAINGKWSFSSWESYAGSAIGGAFTGAAFALGIRNNKALKGINAGFKNLFTHAFEVGTNKKEKFSIANVVGKTIVDFAIASAFEKVKIPGVNKGRHSTSANFKRVVTRIMNDNARNFTGKTVANGLITDFVGDIPKSVFSGVRYSEPINNIRNTVVDGIKNPGSIINLIQNIYIPNKVVLPGAFAPITL